jgi:hypothetical protein
LRLEGLGSKKEGNNEELFAETIVLKNNGTKDALIEVHTSLDLYKVKDY